MIEFSGLKEFLEALVIASWLNVDLWEKARKARCATVQRLMVRLFDASAAWEIHQAMATVASAKVTVQIETTLAAEGIEQLQISYKGSS